VQTEHAATHRDRAASLKRPLMPDVNWCPLLTSQSKSAPVTEPNGKTSALYGSLIRSDLTGRQLAHLAGVVNAGSAKIVEVKECLWSGVHPVMLLINNQDKPASSRQLGTMLAEPYQHRDAFPGPPVEGRMLSLSWVWTR